MPQTSLSIYIKDDDTVTGQQIQKVNSAQWVQWIRVGDLGNGINIDFDSLEAMTLFGLAIVEEARRLLDVQQRTNPTLPQLLADGDAENAEYRANSAARASATHGQAQ